jgi:phosphatidylinositol-3-phosphatase
VNLDPLRRWEQRIGALPMPSPLVWSALAVAFLGFGVLIGRTTWSNSVASLAASRAPLKLLVARAPAASGSSATSPAKSPPLPEAETTPEPSAASASPSETKQAAASGASSSSSSESSKGSEESSATSKGSSPQGSNTKLPAIKHVFVVMLSNEPYATVFGPASPAHYLSGTLEKKGELLVRYYAVAHEELANGIALLSGQGPTEATAANCPTYTDVAPASAGADGQVLGKGCVYPASTNTLMGQLTAKHLSWKAYVGGIGEGTSGPGACAHPASGAPDSSAGQASGQNAGQASGQNAGQASGQNAGQASGQNAASSYQTWRNPFVYFKAIAGSSTCAAHDLGMDGLRGDLAKEGRTANFTYIAPGPCDDGSPTACAPGKASGMMAADVFLRKIVPQILSSKAYKKNGLLAITVDQAPASGEYADSSSCCGQPRFPSLPAPTGAAALSPQGGGQVGLLLLSPFVKGGGLIQDTYNHFSLLATIEQAFGLARLGYAGLSEVKPLSPSLFSGG